MASLPLKVYWCVGCDRFKPIADAHEDELDGKFIMLCGECHTRMSAK